jgi:UDP-glucose 4-epimerase
MRILITGASGFVGKHLVNALDNKHELICIVKHESDFSNVKNLNIVKLDLTNYQAVQRMANDNTGIDVIIHLASHIPSVNNDGKDQFYLQNIIGTLNLIKAYKHIPRFIFASTLDVYGIPVKLPILEDHILTPQTNYGISKLACEHYLKGATNIDQLVVLRFTQIYGPLEKQIKAIPNFILAIKDNKQPVLYGDGYENRDYLYVKDAVNAINCALLYPQSGIFNIASGKSVSVRYMLQTILKLCKSNVEPRYESARKASYDISFDIQLAKRKLKFFPAFSLREGLLEYIHYYGL